MSSSRIHFLHISHSQDRSSSPIQQVLTSRVTGLVSNDLRYSQVRPSLASLSYVARRQISQLTQVSIPSPYQSSSQPMLQSESICRTSSMPVLPTRVPIQLVHQVRRSVEISIHLLHHHQVSVIQSLQITKRIQRVSWSEEHDSISHSKNISVRTMHSQELLSLHQTVQH